MLYLKGTEGCTEKGVQRRIYSVAPEGGTGKQSIQGFRAQVALVSAEQRGPSEFQVVHCPAGPSCKLSGCLGTRNNPIRQEKIIFGPRKRL